MLDTIQKEQFRKTYKLAYPVALSQLGHIATGVADSIMVGQLGSTPLAAASLANSVLSVIMVAGLGVSFGITPMIASADGKNDLTTVGKIFNNGTAVIMITAILITIFLYNLSPVLSILDQPKDVVTLSLPYYHIVLLSMIPIMYFQSFKQFAEGLSHTKQAMVISLSANLLNIILNYILIYGKLGFAPMGLTGAGIATLISRILMAVAMRIYVQNSKIYKPYLRPFRFKNLDKPMMWKIWKIGIPIGFQFTFEVAAFAFAAIMMGWMGAKQLAAHQIALSMAAVTYMLASGISSAATVRVGNALGRNDREGIKHAGHSAYMLALILMATSALIFIFGNKILPGFYIDELDVIDLASSLLIIAALFQLSDGTQVVGLGALRGLSDVKVPTIITFVAYWVIGLPLAYFLAFYTTLGPLGIWLGLLVGLTVSAIFLFRRFEKLRLIIKLEDHHAA